MPDWTPPHRDHPPPKRGEPRAHRAARLGDDDALRALAARAENLNAVFDIGLDPGARPRPATPLMVAAGSGDGATVQTVRLLLELGADPRATTPAGSAAEFACTGLGWNYRPGGDAARLAALLDAGSPLRLEGEAGARLVCDVARQADAERLSLLLARGAPAGPVFDAQAARRRLEQAHAMAQAAAPRMLAKLPRSLRGEVAAGLSASDPAVLEQVPSGPYSFEIPLFAAAEGGSERCVAALLRAGARADQRDGDGATALFYAGSPQVVPALIAAGCPAAAADSSGRDAPQRLLHEQASESPATVERTARAMLEAGVPLTRADEHGRGRLHQAAFAENLHAVRILLALGHPATPDPRGRTALHELCWHWDHGDERDDAIREMIDLLVRAGIDVNARDADGRTALHEAVAGDGGNLVAVEELTRRGADANAQDNEGLTPLAFLYETHFDYARIVPALLAAGANPLIRDARGRTAIDLAVARARGEEPAWRKEQWGARDGPPCGWKPRARPWSAEWRLIARLKKAARRFS